MKDLAVINFKCAGCGAAFSVKDEFAGRKTTCTKCGVVLYVPRPKTPVPSSMSTVPPPLPTTPRPGISAVTSVKNDPSIRGPETAVVNSSVRNWLLLGSLAAAPVLLIIVGIAAFVAFSTGGPSDEVIDKAIRDYFDDIYPTGQDVALLPSLVPRKSLFLEMATPPDGMHLTGAISRGQPIQSTRVHSRCAH